MKSSAARTAQLLAIWASQKNTAEIDRAVRSLAKHYLRRGQLGRLSKITSALKSQSDRRNDVQQVLVRHAGRWSEAELRTMIGQVLYARAKSEYVVTATADPAVLGGVTVTIGDRRISATLAQRLEKLRTMIFSQ